jgi:hypothetical protein
VVGMTLLYFLVWDPEPSSVTRMQMTAKQTGCECHLWHAARILI